jgi:hypothetical protein
LVLAHPATSGQRTLRGGEAEHKMAAPAAPGLVAHRRHCLARSGAEPRRAGQSRAGEADEGKQGGGESEHGFDASLWAAVDKDDAHTWPWWHERWASLGVCGRQGQSWLGRDESGAAQSASQHGSARRVNPRSIGGVFGWSDTGLGRTVKGSARLHYFFYSLLFQ